MSLRRALLASAAAALLAGGTRLPEERGPPGMPAEAIVLDHITIEAPTGLRLANAAGLLLRDVHVKAATGPDVIVDATVSGLVRRD